MNEKNSGFRLDYGGKFADALTHTHFFFTVMGMNWNSLKDVKLSSGKGNGNPLQYSCLENGQRILKGHSPRGCRDLDTTV